MRYGVYAVSKFESVIKIRVTRDRRVRANLFFSVGFYYARIDFPYPKSLQSFWRIS